MDSLGTQPLHLCRLERVEDFWIFLFGCLGVVEEEWCHPLLCCVCVFTAFTMCWLCWSCLLHIVHASGLGIWPHVFVHCLLISSMPLILIVLAICSKLRGDFAAAC